MENIKNTMFINGVYTSTIHIFFGLQCGIIFSHIFRISQEDLYLMSLLELYLNLIIELFLMSIVICWYLPIFNYFGKQFNSDYDYKQKINSNSLFVISFLVGNKSLSEKIIAIINKFETMEIQTISKIQKVPTIKKIQEIVQSEQNIF